MKVAQLCPTLWDPMDYTACGILQARITGVGSCSVLQGVFPTKGLNPDVLHCRMILYQLSHQGSPRILEWVAFPFSIRSSQLRNGTWLSCIEGGFFTSWVTRCIHWARLDSRHLCFNHKHNIKFLVLVILLKKPDFNKVKCKPVY